MKVYITLAVLLILVIGVGVYNIQQQKKIRLEEGQKRDKMLNDCYKKFPDELFTVDFETGECTGFGKNPKFTNNVIHTNVEEPFFIMRGDGIIYNNTINISDDSPQLEGLY